MKRAVAALVLAFGLAAGAHAAHQVAQVEDVIAFLETREIGCAGSQAQELRYWEARCGSSVEVLGTMKRDPNDALARIMAAVPGKHAVYRVAIGLPPPRGSVDLVPLIEWARRKIRATKRPPRRRTEPALDVGVSQSSVPVKKPPPLTTLALVGIATATWADRPPRHQIGTGLRAWPTTLKRRRMMCTTVRSPLTGIATEPRRAPSIAFTICTSERRTFTSR